MRRRRNKLRRRYGGQVRTPLEEAILAVDEPQHGAHLEAVEEHGQRWVLCNRCGRQWGVYGDAAEVVAVGDGHCDEELLRNPVKTRLIPFPRKGGR